MAFTISSVRVRSGLGSACALTNFEEIKGWDLHVHLALVNFKEIKGWDLHVHLALANFEEIKNTHGSVRNGCLYIGVKNAIWLN